MVAELVITVTGLEAAKRKLEALNKPRLLRGIRFFVIRRMEENLKTVKELAPKGVTGKLSENIDLEVSAAEDRIEAQYIVRAAYARWVTGGTGIFGPQKQKIVPVKAKYMVFFKENKWVRTKSVKGQPPNKFLSRAALIIRKRLRHTLPIVVRNEISVILGETT